MTRRSNYLSEASYRLTERYPEQLGITNIEPCLYKGEPAFLVDVVSLSEGATDLIERLEAEGWEFRERAEELMERPFKRERAGITLGVRLPGKARSFYFRNSPVSHREGGFRNRKEYARAAHSDEELEVVLLWHHDEALWEEVLQGDDARRNQYIRETQENYKEDYE